MENYFVKLNSLNVNEHTEKKNGLTYLSWAWAWAECKKLFPDATYTVYENDNLGGMPYFTDGTTAMVKTGVTINGIEHIEYLPVMDHRNKSIPLSAITSFDVNKTIQRSLTKALARHGLGLYIYAGEDLPEENADDIRKEILKLAPIDRINRWLERQVEANKISETTTFETMEVSELNRLRAAIYATNKK